MNGRAGLGLLVAAMAALAGCPRERPLPPPPVAATAVPQPPADADGDIGNECREQVADLQDWLRAVQDAGLPLSLSLLDEGAHLVQRPGAAIQEPAPLVHLTKAGAFLDGVPVEDATALQHELTELIELRRSMMPESPFIKSPRCYLAVDGEVGWAQLVDVVGQLAAAGVEQVTFLFGDPERKVPSPPPSPIDREIERMQKSTQLRRQQIIAELFAYVYQDCPQGLKVIASMGVNPVADFKQVILDALPEAMAECSCAPDPSSVKALHWALFGNPRPTAGATVRITPPEQPAAPLEQAADTPWSAAAAKVVAASGDDDVAPVRLQVAAPAEPSGDAPDKAPKSAPKTR